MPTRLLREGILDSDAVDQLDAPSEVFYRRLMSKVDDHGLFDARASILRSHLYPLRADKVREADIARWMAACQKAGLIVLYTAGGKPFGKMLNTQWEARSKPKHPLPPEDICKQLQTTVPLVVDVVGVVVEDEGGKARKRARAPETSLPEDFAISDRVKAWAAEKGHKRLGEHLETFVNKCKAKDYRYRDWDAAFMNAVSEDWGKVVGRPTAVVKPEDKGLSALEELEAQGRRAGLTRGVSESTPDFRARVDAARQEARH